MTDELMRAGATDSGDAEGERCVFEGRQMSHLHQLPHHLLRPLCRSQHDPGVPRWRITEAGGSGYDADGVRGMGEEGDIHFECLS